MSHDPSRHGKDHRGSSPNDDNRIGARAVIYAALITGFLGAIATVAAAFIGHAEGRSEAVPGPTVTVTVTREASGANSPAASGGTSGIPTHPAVGTGSLYNIQQSPSARQNASALTVNGKKYAGAFQLTIPSYQYLKFTYALNGQWSSIKLFVAIPDIGTKTVIPITVNVDGQTQSEDSLDSDDAFMYSHSFDISGAKKLELDLADTYGYSTVVIVAGDLSH